MTVVALLHPGAMGSRLGGELVAGGHEVRWLAEGRSPASVVRAERDGLRPTAAAGALLDGADMVLSVLPPQFAVEVARLVSDAGFSETYLDANPLSPDVLEEVRQLVTGPGATFVDGGVVGPPPRSGASTNLYLAGESSAVVKVRALFADTAVTAVVVGDRVGQASAAKQAYALFNKGRMVLAASAARLAAAHGVSGVLAGESLRPGADLLGELDDVLDGLAEAGWRWGPELDQIADALAASGIDGSVARALAADLRGFGSAPAPG